MTLEAAGYQVVSASNGHEALRHSDEVTTEDATHADAWLSKPVKPKRLLETVRRLLAHEQ